MNDPMGLLPKYFQKHFYLGTFILVIVLMAKAILWMFRG